jgi:hypothetical protein
MAVPNVTLHWPCVPNITLAVPNVTMSVPNVTLQLAVPNVPWPFLTSPPLAIPNVILAVFLMFQNPEIREIDKCKNWTEQISFQNCLGINLNA